MSLFNLFLLSSCYPARMDGPYEGRIIDAETKQPIEGVVVLGVWYKEEPTVAGAVSSYYDATETVTDKNGDFKIKGKGLLVLTNVAPISVLIFKAGYSYDSGPWEGFKTGYLSNKKVKWEGGKAIIPLRKLTMEERKQTGPPSRPPIPIQKMKLLTREVNRERIELNLEPFDLGGNQ